MATWKIHNNIAVKCKDVLEVTNMNEYLLGAIFPDLLRLEGSYDKDIVRGLHEYLPRMGTDGVTVIDAFFTPNVPVFLIKYKDEIIKSDFFKGWFTHICIDYMFNDFANRRVLSVSNNGKYVIKTKAGIEIVPDRHVLVGMKHDDFSIYGSSLIAMPIAPFNMNAELLSFIENKIKQSFSVLKAVDEHNRIISSTVSEEKADTVLFSKREYDIICMRCIQYIDIVYDSLFD